MAKRKRGPIDYIRERSGTKNLWFRYQFPEGMGWKNYEKTLGTPDLKTARERAAPHLMKCVAWVEEYKARINPSEERRQVATLSWRYPPDLKGQQKLPDGRTVQIVDGLCLIAAPNGDILEAKPNLVRTAVEGVFWTRAEYQGAVDEGHLGDGQLLEWDCPGWRGEAISLPESVKTLEQARAPLDGGLIADDKPAHRSKPRPCADDTFLEVYLKHRAITGKDEVEARRSWTDFRTLTSGKPLKDCERADGRMLADYYFARNNKRATVQKKIMWLNAMVRLAMKDPRSNIRFNPFEDAVLKGDDAEKREEFSEEDMALARKLGPAIYKPDADHPWRADVWPLWVILATTGMRLSEALAIVGEKSEHGVRYIQIKKGKTKQSIRDVPLPDGFLAVRPEKIVGPLFPNWTPKLGTQRMNRWIERIGIKADDKVIHSLRHRAKSKLRKEEDCKESIEFALLGHERITNAARYGKRPPMPVLKKWVDKIGY